VHPAAEALEELDRERHVEAVGEHHRLAARVDAHLVVMGDQLLAPLERIAGIVPHAVEELAEEEIEIAQERVHPQTSESAMPKSPRYSRAHMLKREHLGVAQPGTHRLARLQVLVRHRAQRGEPQLLRELDVARADELGPMPAASVRSTSPCQARENRRRVP
jgi:hypothetical protein